jgi:hypothetical protein
MQGQPSVPIAVEHHVCPAQHAAPFEMHAAGRIVRRARLLEGLVADREDLVEQEDLRIER